MSDAGRTLAEAAYPLLSLLVGGERIGADARSTQAVTDPSNERVLGHLPGVEGLAALLQSRLASVTA